MTHEGDKQSVVTRSKPEAHRIPKVSGSTAFRIALTGICTIAYFTITETGSNSLIELFNLHGTPEQIALAVLGVLASFTTGALFYLTLQNINFKPTTMKQGLFASLVPLAASPFFTGPLLGSESLGLPIEASITSALLVYGMRFSILWDGAVKAPEQLRIMADALRQSWAQKDWSNIARLSVASLLSIGYAASVSDAVYAAMNMTLSAMSVDSNIIPDIAYTGTLIGCLGTLPFVLYRISEGLDQLTFGQNYRNNPTDRYTAYAFVLSIPSVLGILGGAAEASGQALAQLGDAGVGIRMLSSLGYGLTIGTKAYSNILRKIAGPQQSEPAQPLLVSTADNTNKEVATGHDYYSEDQYSPTSPDRETSGYFNNPHTFQSEVSQRDVYKELYGKRPEEDDTVNRVLDV